MDTYTITIAPNDGSGNSTTLIVATTGDRVRITDVTLHAPEGLTGGRMPTVDFGLLLRAVANPATSAIPIEATTDTPAPADVTDVAASTDHAATLADGTPRPPRTARATAKQATPERAPHPHPRARRTGKATTARTATARPAKADKGASTTATKKPATRRAAAQATTSGRAYRRMPDDIASVYQQTSTPAAIADHYGVPRHTAQGWIRRVKATTTAPAAG